MHIITIVILSPNDAHNNSYHGNHIYIIITIAQECIIRLFLVHYAQQLYSYQEHFELFAQQMSAHYLRLV